MEDEQQFQQGDGITKSTFNDIVNTLGAEEAKKIIAVMRKDPNAQVIERAQVLFPVVPLATIKQILGKNKFKLQLCIDELERENERVAKKKKEEEMKKRELQLAKQREEDLKKVINQFHQISKEEITRIFKEAGQDIRKTVVKIKSLLKEKLKKEAQERARSAVKFKLHQQFSQLDSKLIDFTIEQQDYNLEKATVKLNEIAHEMIVDNLFNSINGQLQKEQLFKMLQENNWNQTEAYKVALQCIEEKKKEEVPKEVMQSLKDEERTQSLLISSALENEITNEVAEGDKQVTSEIASTLQNILEPQGENAQKGEEKGDKPTVSVEKVNEKVVAKVNFPSHSQCLGGLLQERIS